MDEEVWIIGHLVWLSCLVILFGYLVWLSCVLKTVILCLKFCSSNGSFGEITRGLFHAGQSWKHYRGICKHLLPRRRFIHLPQGETLMFYYLPMLNFLASVAINECC